MATATALYGTTTAFTLTLTSLADKAVRQSTVVSNASTLALDYQISGLFTVGAAAANGDMYVLLYSYDGNNYSYPATGTDGGVTPADTFFAGLDGLQYGQVVPGTELIFGAKVPLKGLAATVAVGLQSFNISQAFQQGGLNPPIQFGVVVVNFQGQALDATAAHNTMYYTSIKQTIA